MREHNYFPAHSTTAASRAGITFVGCGGFFMPRNNIKHGYLIGGVPKEYAAWSRMKSRCNNPSFIEFDKYGGRGITVCEKWSKSFEAFITDVGPRPSPQHSLDRINNNGNYEPGNVRWATRIQQMNNTSRTRLLTLNGKTQGLCLWAYELGVRPKTLRKRLKIGWSDEDILTTPFPPSCRR